MCARITGPRPAGAGGSHLTPSPVPRRGVALLLPAVKGVSARRTPFPAAWDSILATAQLPALAFPQHPDQHRP
jgi:hypothetical protein